MNIRQAILKAADSIEQNPELFNFMSTTIPNCGTPGCAMGWTLHHLGFPQKSVLEHEYSKVVDPNWITHQQNDFYPRMRELCGSYDWKRSATECARVLRLYADDQFPEKGIPESVLEIFNENRSQHDGIDRPLSRV